MNKKHYFPKVILISTAIIVVATAIAFPFHFVKHTLQKIKQNTYANLIVNTNQQVANALATLIPTLTINSTVNPGLAAVPAQAISFFSPDGVTVTMLQNQASLFALINSAIIQALLSQPESAIAKFINNNFGLLKQNLGIGLQNATFQLSTGTIQLTILWDGVSSTTKIQVHGLATKLPKNTGGTLPISVSDFLSALVTTTKAAIALKNLGMLTAQAINFNSGVTNAFVLNNKMRFCDAAINILLNLAQPGSALYSTFGLPNYCLYLPNLLFAFPSAQYNPINGTITLKLGWLANQQITMSKTAINFSHFFTYSSVITGATIVNAAATLLNNLSVNSLIGTILKLNSINVNQQIFYQPLQSVITPSGQRLSLFLAINLAMQLNAQSNNSLSFINNSVNAWSAALSLNYASAEYNPMAGSITAFLAYSANGYVYVSSTPITISGFAKVSDNN